MAAATRGILHDGLWTLCVDFFFILSGFVLYRSMARKRPSIIHYFSKRLRRLAPVFLIGTLAMLLFGPPQTLGTIAANLLMVQSLINALPGFVSPVVSIDHPSWSIPFELFLPALALLALTPLKRAGRGVALALAGAMLVGSAYFAFALSHNVDDQIGRAFFNIGFGFALGRVHRIFDPRRARPIVVLALFASTLVIMALAGRFPAIVIVFPLVSGICILCGAQTTTLLSTRPFQALGRWSYAIYLMHIPVLTLVGVSLGSADGNPAMKGLVVVATIALAAALFHFVEAPLMRARTVPVLQTP